MLILLEIRSLANVAIPPILRRMLASAGLGLGAGVLAGILIGVVESLVVAAGGFGRDAQILWYGPLAYSVVCGGLCTLGGALLGVLPMSREKLRGWTPSLAMLATLVPMGLFITIFRLRRDVYLEQTPPMPVLAGVLTVAGIVALVLLFGGRRIFASPIGTLARPTVASSLLAVLVVSGAIASSWMSRDLAAGEGPAPIPAHLSERPNITLVMVDTLRADHLSCYGARTATPNICSLAADGGSQFTGFSHASWTKPATASLLTSLLPSTHEAVSKSSRLSEEVDLVAEVLHAQGYSTGGIVSTIDLAERFGFDQGYDEYHYVAPTYLPGADESSSKLVLHQLIRSIDSELEKGLYHDDFYQDAKRVNEVAFDWIDRHAQERFFLFLHYMDPHEPYFEHPYDGKGISRAADQHPDAALAEEMRRLYVGEIEYLDRQFGSLLAKLREQQIYDDTLIALVADHGEEFQEHGGWWHGLTLYDEQIHVPLLIKWPAGKRGAPPMPDRIARLIDVVPTLIGQAGAKPSPAMQGVDLTADPDVLSTKDRQVYSEGDHEGNVLWSLRTRDWKYIRANPGNGRGLPEEELFQLGVDAGETRNLAGGEHFEIEQELLQHAELQRSFAEGESVADGGDAEMSLEQCRKLMHLGYVEDCSHLN